MKHLGEIQGAFFMPWRRTNPAKIRCNRILAEMSAVRKESSMQIMPILSENDMSLFELRTLYTRNYLTSAGKNCKDGSMLDTYGGEYEWDMYTALLHGYRGADHGIKIVYGKNLIDFKMERSNENMITDFCPYWKHSEDGTLFELSEKVVTIEHDGSYEKISVLDCTSHFEEKPTEAQLRNYVKQYLKNTSLT